MFLSTAAALTVMILSTPLFALVVVPAVAIMVALIVSHVNSPPPNSTIVEIKTTVYLW